MSRATTRQSSSILSQPPPSTPYLDTRETFAELGGLDPRLVKAAARLGFTYPVGNAYTKKFGIRSRRYFHSLLCRHLFKRKPFHLDCWAVTFLSVQRRGAARQLHMVLCYFISCLKQKALLVLRRTCLLSFSCQRASSSSRRRLH